MQNKICVFIFVIFDNLYKLVAGKLPNASAAYVPVGKCNKCAAAVVNIVQGHLVVRAKHSSEKFSYFSEIWCQSRCIII